MVKSMTGYGSFTISSDNYKVTVELKSLNSKFVELNLKIPKNYMQNELVLRNLLTQHLKRGKISAVLTVEVLNPEKHPLRINRPLVAAYVRELKSMREEMGIISEPDFGFLMTLPDAMSSEPEEADPEEWKLIELAFQNAVKELVESRRAEGKALERDLGIRCELIHANLKEIEKRLVHRLENVRTRMLQTLNELQDSFNIDGNRFEQELIYYIEKMDINEEIVRLTKHLEYFVQTLDEEESNGKKLGFIAQEIGREINTIGSKANDAEIQVFVVKMKEELEKIKEQVRNIQ
ncbi:MAG: YicC family protein [Bacteroidia bacterium]|nr:YicC family protein [Bacteroidia bacterium]